MAVVMSIPHTEVCASCLVELFVTWLCWFLALGWLARSHFPAVLALFHIAADPERLLGQLGGVGVPKRVACSGHTGKAAAFHSCYGRQTA